MLCSSRTSTVGVALMLLAACTSHTATGDPLTSPLAPGTAPALHVGGHRLLDGHNRPVLLHGVSRSGTEFRCHPESGIGGAVFDGPSDDASIDAITSWRGINAVRIPLNEDCWLGLQGADPTAAGLIYQVQVEQYVKRLHRHGLVAILDLHWTTGLDDGKYVMCPTATAACQKSMPDAAHAPAFWSSVAEAFKDDLSTVFDVFNEPFPNAAHHMRGGPAWRCWRDGGSRCPGYPFEVAGMQSLVDAVRSTGARNVVMVGGLDWAGDLTGWLAHRPRDRTGNLAASWHTYNYTGCVNPNCWNRQIAPVAKAVPVITGEIGQNDCKTGYVDRLMPWLDAHRISYLAWTWNTWNICKTSPVLISDYDGTPTGYGRGVRDHLARISRS